LPSCGIPKLRETEGSGGIGEKLGRVRLAAPLNHQQIQFHQNFDSMVLIVKVRRGAPYEAFGEVNVQITKKEDLVIFIRIDLLKGAHEVISVNIYSMILIVMVC